MSRKDAKRNERIIQLRNEGYKYDDIIPIIKREFNVRLSNSRMHQIYNYDSSPKKKAINPSETLFINLNEIQQKQIIIKIGGRTITIQ